MKAGERIHSTVLSWTGVTSGTHRFGGEEYRLGRREIGHVHDNSLVDIPFPKPVRDELIAAGKAQPHHVLPSSGWISFRIRSAEDVEQAIALLRRSYDLALSEKSQRDRMTLSQPNTVLIKEIAS